VRHASAQSRNCRSKDVVEIAMGSDAPDAAALWNGGGSPLVFDLGCWDQGWQGMCHLPCMEK